MAIINSNALEQPVAPKITILLATYFGQGFLADQLASIEAQDHANWVLWASDDGSTDGTLDLLEAYRERNGSHKVRIVKGPCKGAIANFISLAVNREIRANYYAFCDQDDVWLTGRLSRALVQTPQVTFLPTLVGNRTIIVDQNLKRTGLSPLFTKPPSFRNALVQSIAGGNTMLFNQARKKSAGRSRIRLRGCLS